MSPPPTGGARAGTRLAVITITACLYAVGKWATAFIRTPWGVGELLVGIFLPALMVVACETVPAAIGAGIGTFLGDFLVTTTPALSIVAGVPANFIAFLFFGLFVKRYRSWPAFVAATVSFVTLGNLIAATAVYFFGYALAGVRITSSAILGLTIFWNTTSIPAIIIAVPILLRAIHPLYGRSRILEYYPDWSPFVRSREVVLALAGAMAFVLLGLAVFVISPDSVSSAPGLGYFALAGVLVIVFGPVLNAFAGPKGTNTVAA